MSTLDTNLLADANRIASQLRVDLAAMTVRNTELARRVSELERGLTEACAALDEMVDHHPVAELLRQLAIGGT